MKQLLFLCIVVGFYTTSAQRFNQNRVDLTVYYETLCPYSMEFFTKQLKPIWDELKEFINIQLVPYGHSNQSNKNGTWEFRCHHGINECLYNTYHACIIDVVADNDKIIHILSCLMSTRLEINVLDSCLTNEHIRWKMKSDIQECIGDNRGKELLAMHGDKTNTFKPKEFYVPNMVFNNIYNEETRIDAYYDLREVICLYLNPKPNVCSRRI